MKNKKYIKRYVDTLMQKCLKTFGAINVVGPKWCGKTESSKAQAKTILKIDDFSVNEINNSINCYPRKYLVGNYPILIDEWQMAPHVWDVVRNIVDESQKTGRFIITGSTSTRPKTAHTGTGRIHDLIMYPMSLYESGESNGSISLSELFKNKAKLPSSCTLDLYQIIFASCRGGWPYTIVTKNKNKQLYISKSYYSDIYTKDILNLKDPSTKPKIMKDVLETYSRNISTYANNSTLYNDIGIDKDTLTTYIDVLERLYIVNELEPWSYSLRSKNAIRGLHKREFVDPSIAVWGLKSNPEKLINDLNTFGFIFETMCIRDLRIYSSAFGGEIYYYRDKNGLECDCVLVLDNGDYALIEIKLGYAQIDEGISNLIRLEKQIINNNFKEKDAKKWWPLPKFKMVLTGTEVAYKHESGVYIIPIGCLKD